jgi:hypothetical protein
VPPPPPELVEVDLSLLPVDDPPIEEIVQQTTGEKLDLGNSDMGSGDVQPQAPGDPAPPEAIKAPYKQDATAPDPSNEDASNPITEDNNDKAPEVYKPKTPVPNPKPVVNTKPVTPATRRSPVTRPATDPNPPPRRPRSVMTAPNGTGPGGNNSDGFNNSRGQGPGNGSGDYGRPNGSIGGTTIRGNRRFGGGYTPRSLQGCEGNATVTIVFRVDEDGRVISKRAIKGAGAENCHVSKAMEEAARMSFTSGNIEETVDVIFKFRIKS